MISFTKIPPLVKFRKLIRCDKLYLYCQASSISVALKKKKHFACGFFFVENGRKFMAYIQSKEIKNQSWPNNDKDGRKKQEV